MSINGKDEVPFWPREAVIHKCIMVLMPYCSIVAHHPVQPWTRCETLSRRPCVYRYLVLDDLVTGNLDTVVPGLLDFWTSGHLGMNFWIWI